jgi:hypothetical protein
MTTHLGLGATLVGAVFTAGLGSLLIPLAGLFEGARTVLLLIMAEVLVRAGSVIFGINAVSLRQTVSPDRLLGRVTATSRMVSWGATPLGALLGGALGETLGVVPTRTVAAVGTLLASAWIVCSPVRSMRNEADV